MYSRYARGVFTVGILVGVPVWCQPPKLAPAQSWLRQEVLTVFAGAARRALALAEAMPHEKFAWRPMEGTRSFGEVACMSDDGKVAWYFSGAARLFRIDLDTGEAQERLGRTPQIGLGMLIGMTPGSLYSIPGAGFSDLVYAADSYPLPRSLGGVSVIVNGVDCPLVSVSPTKVLLQVPSHTDHLANVEVKTESSSSFVPQLRFTESNLIDGMFLRNPQSFSAAYGGLEALAIHQDWSALVTADSPARPVEILHLYGTGSCIEWTRRAHGSQSGPLCGYRSHGLFRLL